LKQAISSWGICGQCEALCQRADDLRSYLYIS
jgi:hypothetical protein